MINKGLFTSNKDDWRTPKWLFNVLNDHFRFHLDVCSDDDNALCKFNYTLEKSCLEYDWLESNYMNCPYGKKISLFVARAHQQWRENDCTTVALLPARTDTKWFHNFIYYDCTIAFIKGRIKFEGGEKLSPAPFPSMVVVWWGSYRLNEKDFVSGKKLSNMIEEARKNET